MDFVFFNCTVVRCFWDVVSEHVKRFYVFDLLKESVLLGYVNEQPFFNFIILVTKNYIYHCKLKERIPNTIEFKSNLKYFYSVEQYNANKNHCMHKFEQRWAPFNHIFP